VKGFGIKSFLRVVHVNSENEWDNDEIEKAGKQYYESFRDSTDLLIKLVEKAQQRLRARLEEEKDSPDINLLTAQWRRDHQPGRYLIWTQRNPEAEKGARISHGAVLKELEDEFRSIIEEKETGHMRLMRKKINLSGVRGKAAGLFQKKDTDELERLAEGLTHITSSEARKLLYLTRGYLAELHGNMTQAFEEYNKLLSDETDPALLEDALQRIAVICIDNRDTENAVTALECLAQLSSTYAPQYADILRLTGDRETAAEVYSDYLQKVPDDLGTMLKLGKLYKDMRADEAAQMAFNYVLERDPDNGAARAMLQT
jgi:tetratricopeptide (TPR) repeat protein